MDLYNNKVGRDLATDGGYGSAQDALKDAIRRRLLRTTPYD